VNVNLLADTAKSQLSTSCGSFTTSITPVLSSRTRLNLVRSNISSIEDILSIPRLVSTCVRGGWWSEAMELAYRARDLEQILKPNRPPVPSKRDLLSRVREEVEVEVKTLRARILEGLRSRSLKLPGAVRSITLLRRMSSSALSDQEASSSLSEPELRMALLTSRWECLRSQLDQLEVSAGSGASSEDRLKYVKRWIEVWREVVGETVTIHNEIFLTSHNHPTSPLQSFKSSKSKQSPSLTSAISNGQQPPSLQLENPQIPLALFLSQALLSLQTLLTNQLPQITAISSLSSLQTQLSYCSTAFSKFGFDFRYLPNQLITARVLDVLKDRFSQATEVFGRDLARAVTQSGARGGKPRIVLGALIASEGRSSILSLEDEELSIEGEDGRTITSTQPQSFVSLFPPLARLLNAHAMALNELRLLPLVALFQPIQKAQYENLLISSQELENFINTANASLSDSLASPALSDDADVQRQNTVLEEDKILLKRFTLVFTKSVLPWCRWALREGVYPDITSSVQGEQRTEGDEQNERLREAAERQLAAVGIVRPPPSEAVAAAPAQPSSTEVAEAPQTSSPEAGPAEGLTVNGNGHVEEHTTSPAEQVESAPAQPVEPVSAKETTKSPGEGAVAAVHEDG